MSKMNAGKSAALVLLVVALLGGLWPMQAPAQRAEAGQEKPDGKIEKYYYGEELCSKCHNLSDEKAKEEVPIEQAVLYRGVEMRTWKEKDKHRNATKVLLDERAQLMQKNLGYPVHTSAKCLSCHGVVVSEKSDFHATFAPEKRAESGVTCVACHGEHKDWVNKHALVVGDDWKQLQREDKAKFGLKDLWNPEVRAALCASCHVGNVNEGKFVTHEMYAAGHPPLPGIEIATFGDALPRHWETLTEKVQRHGGKEIVIGKRKMYHTEFYKEKHHFDPGKDFSKQMEQTQMVVHSAIAVFRASMEMIAAQAEDHAAQKNGDGWPEFAMYDCYACHHDLKSDSWRLTRPSSGVAGRPGARTWSATLLPLVITHVKGDEKEFADKLERLDRAFTATPFGKAGDIANASRELVKWSKALQKEVTKAPFTRTDSKALLKSMFDHSAAKPLDFDSARQMSWGAKALLDELHPKLVYGVFDPKTRLRPELESSPFNDLNKLLSLTLPQGPVPIVGELQKKTLENMAKFEPKDFQAEMKKVAGSVQKD